MMFRKFLHLPLLVLGVMHLNACADVDVPQARNVDIPSPVTAEKRSRAINERPDSVMYLPLGDDVLVPAQVTGGKLPDDIVGPYELRAETLAGALQLILADYDVSIAFETDEGLSRQITVANLRGPLGAVVERVCSLADLYCSYEGDALIVKDTQTFTVTLPPLGDAEGGQDFINDVIQGLTAIIGNSGTAPVSDPTTRTLIYSATQRTANLADAYFQRLRANTALIVFETYIWEVSLDGGNSTGINWDAIESFGKFNASLDFSGSVAADFTNPISIGLPTTQAIGATPTDLIEFLSQFGAVKAISQPQITVLSGASAQLRVADTENYVSEVSQTINGDNTTTSVSTDSVDSGFTLTIGSSWDKSTVYANVNVNLTNVDQIEDFTFSDGGTGGTDTIIQLPQTTERELITQIRVRPGDSVLIAGLVRERDNFNTSGLGFMSPVVPDSRTAQTNNLELVILLRPRVIVYTNPNDKKYQAFIEEKRNEFILSPAGAVLDVQMPEPLREEPMVELNFDDIIEEPIQNDPEPIEVPTFVVREEELMPETSSEDLSPIELPTSPSARMSQGYVSRESSEFNAYQVNEPMTEVEMSPAPDVMFEPPSNVYDAYERSKN
ncbi:MAG: type II and III secretion system family protein [Pseudomonadota bacterium]